MATTTLTHEDPRTQQVEDDKNLSELAHGKPKSKRSLDVSEPRRSSRARSVVPSYSEKVDNGTYPSRKGAKSSSSGKRYTARPLEELKTASNEERNYALRLAEKLQSGLQSGHPSFVKSLVPSNVYKSFWLGIPSKFCKDHLPSASNELKMILEDESGSEYDTIYLGIRAGLSGGWRAFALGHKLDDGDAVVFELVGPTRFKVYIVRASSQGTDEFLIEKEVKGVDESFPLKVQEKEKVKPDESKKVTKNGESDNGVSQNQQESENIDKSIPQKLQEKDGVKDAGEPKKDINLLENGNSISQKPQQKNDSQTMRKKRNPSTKLFRRKVYY